MEAAIFAYWVKLRIFTFLPIVAVLGAATAYAGRGALVQRHASRTKL
jgi:hypothetical protein